MTGWVRYLYFSILFIGSADAAQIFGIELNSNEVVFPSNLALYDDAVEYSFTITNNTNFDMPNVVYSTPSYFTVDNTKSTCRDLLSKNSSCKIVFKFKPLTIGKFSENFTVCSGNNNWCSKYGQNLDVIVSQKYIVSTNCSEIQERPFADLSCKSSEQYAANFGLLIGKILNSEAVHREFSLYMTKKPVMPAWAGNHLSK